MSFPLLLERRTGGKKRTNPNGLAYDRQPELLPREAQDWRRRAVLAGSLQPDEQALAEGVYNEIGLPILRLLGVHLANRL